MAAVRCSIGGELGSSGAKAGNAGWWWCSNPSGCASWVTAITHAGTAPQKQPRVCMLPQLPQLCLGNEIALRPLTSMSLMSSCSFSMFSIFRLLSCKGWLRRAVWAGAAAALHSGAQPQSMRPVKRNASNNCRLDLSSRANSRSKPGTQRSRVPRPQQLQAGLPS